MFITILTLFLNITKADWSYYENPEVIVFVKDISCGDLWVEPMPQPPNRMIVMRKWDDNSWVPWPEDEEWDIIYYVSTYGSSFTIQWRWGDYAFHDINSFPYNNFFKNNIQSKETSEWFGGVVDLCFRIYADLNYDCKVNFIDYAIFANNWLCDCSDPNLIITGVCIDNENLIDYNRLVMIAENWLCEN